MNLTAIDNMLPSTDPAAVVKLEELEQRLEQLPQIELATTHTLHDGVYTRTVVVPAGAFVTGVVIKIPTTLIVAGDTTVLVGTQSKRLTGYHVLTGAANRKQAVYAHSDTCFTMLFKTEAKTIAEAEAEFTDEAWRLMSNRCDNYLISSEVHTCLV